MYPPLINILSYFKEDGIDYQLIGDYKTASTKFKILNQLSLYFNYVKFIFNGFFALLKEPNSVLYYESLSAMPITFYLFFFKKSKLRIFAHFHEYFSREEYQRQSLLERMGRKYEESLFKRAEWISHTNKDRLDLFKNDIDFNIADSVLKIMPNYPSKSWMSCLKNTRSLDDRIKLLHIGSISFTGMFLKEVLDYYGNHDKFEIHFYSHTTDSKLVKTLESYSSVYHHGSIDYNKIPDLKNKYDVGLVLYKGKSLNFTYNAPNKIFEYLAIDLDVWCSDKLLTAKRYKNNTSYPKMIMVDFENLNEFNENIALDKTGLSLRKSNFYCENVYSEITTQLKAEE